MPWCDTCSRFWNPPSMEDGGRCPTCHAVIAQPSRSGGAPWHFKVLLVGLVVYLSYRLYELIAWLAVHL